MELYHHGVKGQKWGVRRYQYADGSLTPAGKKRYNTSKGSSTAKKLEAMFGADVNYLIGSTKTVITGKQYVDGYLSKGTTFARIQTSQEFEKFAFYATYKQADTNKYMGLFGKNLVTRANADAKRAEKQANASGSEEDALTAKQLRDRADSIKVYQLKLSATKKLKISSDENAADITANLLKESDFKENVIASIQDLKEKMRRPTQQILFNQAQKALAKDPGRMSSAEKIAVYKALNLSLTNHNAQEIAAQNRFYGELKKKGYNALLDYNDKEFSSYHAKRPMIVFDVDSVKLNSVAETNPKVVNRMYTIYNAERLAKDSITNTLGLITRMGSMSVNQASSYVDDKMKTYLQ